MVVVGWEVGGWELVDRKKTDHFKLLMPAVTVQTFHCASYQGTDMVQERGTTAALRHKSGIFADLKS